MKFRLFFVAIFIFIGTELFSQVKSLYEVCNIFEGVAEEIEKGVGVSAAKLREYSLKLRKNSFYPIPENLLVRLDSNQVDTTLDSFFYLPEYIDSLLKSGYSRVYADDMYKKFKLKGNKGSSDNMGCFYLDTQTLKRGKIAKIKLYTKNSAEVAVIAQPFARISVEYYDSENKNITGTDPFKNKGYLKSIKSFYHRGAYWITLCVKNATDVDISFTIVAN